jgi:dihydroflavonol-4-reductase
VEQAERKGFWKGRAVAVTGATGFIGHHLALLLQEAGAEVTALVRGSSKCQRLAAAGIVCRVAPLEDLDALTAVCRGCEFIFHVAGAVDFESDWQRFETVNVEGTRHVLTAARRCGVRRLIHTSSIVAVAASDRPHCADETSSWNLARLKVPYVTTKRRAEEAALSASDRRLEVVAVNPACVIGPDDWSRSEFGTLCRRFWRGRIPFHFGGGANFVDVRDVARGHLLAAERGQAGQRYLLGGENRSYPAFFSELARVAGRPIFRLRLPNALATFLATLNASCRKRSARSYLTPAQVRVLSLYFYFDCSKAQDELGYRARPLRQTLRDTHAFWMKASA